MVRTGVDCFACFMQQALTAVKQCTEDPKLQSRVLILVGNALAKVRMEESPPVNLAPLYQLICTETNTLDPFARTKKRENDYVLALKQSLQETVGQAVDQLLVALRLAIGGNVLDSGAQQQLDIKQTLAKCQAEPLAINHYEKLLEKLSKSRRVLYLTDNCGEIVFDKLVIQ